MLSVGPKVTAASLGDPDPLLLVVAYVFSTPHRSMLPVVPTVSPSIFERYSDMVYWIVCLLVVSTLCVQIPTDRSNSLNAGRLLFFFFFGSPESDKHRPLGLEIIDNGGPAVVTSWTTTNGAIQ